MTDVAWVTLVLVGVTVVYIGVVCTQVSQSRQFIGEQIRYLVEGDITQLRLKKAEFLYRANERIEDGKTPVKYHVKYHGKTPIDIIEDREKQYDETVKRIAKEMKSSILSREIDRLIGKIRNGEKANNG